MVTTELAVWQVAAVNLAEHGENPIHTDEGGRAAGFPGALVAGVTTYAYLTHPAAVAWGAEWIGNGGADVRFLSPVLDGDDVVCTPAPADESGAVLVEAVARGEARAVATFRRRADAEPVAGRPGEALPPIVLALDGSWADYGTRAGDDAAIYRDEGVVHPAVWPSLANRAVSRNLVDGSWIHTRSAIRHHRVASVGEEVEITATVVDRFDTRMGERAVLEVVIGSEAGTVATLEHEAIVRVRA